MSASLLLLLPPSLSSSLCESSLSESESFLLFELDVLPGRFCVRTCFDVSLVVTVLVVDAVVAIEVVVVVEVDVVVAARVVGIVGADPNEK